MTRLLILFDVDGTLFLTDDPLVGRALSETLNASFGVDLAPDAIAHVDHEGQPALLIARLILRRAGLPDPEIDRGLKSWCGRFAERYLELLAGADTSGWRAAPDAAAVLERLTEAGHRLVLLTGNPEPIAWARMDRLGLARFFAPSEGAFGCDSESRADLVAIARSRSGGWPAEATVEVGDTQRDASSAREAGIRSLLVDDSGLAAVAGTLLAGEG